MPITNISKKSVLAKTFENADTPSKRMKGLLGRASMSKGEALVISSCQSIHMFFMKFPIDVVFLCRENKVTGIVENIKPFGLSPIFWKATCAIELPMGTIEATGTKVGDEIQIIRDSS